MSGTDATRTRHRVADPLRSWARETADEPEVIGFLDAMADGIDREQDRRMRQQSRELRRSFCRYIGGVINDYRFGIKRRKPRKLLQRRQR